MSNYNAVLLDWDTKKDLGPVDVSHAVDDNDAKAIAVMNTGTWLTEHNVERIHVQVVREGKSVGIYGVRADGTEIELKV